MAAAEQRVLQASTSAVPYSWSPDGKYLLYGTSEAKTSTDLWILGNPGDPAAEHKSTPFLQTEFRESAAQFSPDGRWVAYVSDASSRPEIYVRPFPPGRDNAGQWMVSSSGGSQPRWNRNGKELLYFSGRKLMSVEVNLNGIFRAGIPKPLFDAPVLGGTDALGVIDWDVSPDGSRFLVLTNQSADTSGTPISVIVNWQELLRK
jgi:dipeptidyl aminopeptidase/acylaminoacyl peptidase